MEVESAGPDWHTRLVPFRRADVSDGFRSVFAESATLLLYAGRAFPAAGLEMDADHLPAYLRRKYKGRPAAVSAALGGVEGLTPRLAACRK